ncbi:MULTISPECIES: helix-turn-helix transcriptional regulator [Halomonas]|uniref:Helix-turn-helix transcriptional regulator n=1 Tax=Halomonas colorata TaxID=2742615 RepID=A0ABR9FW21_9GAMM|nr:MULTISPECIES: AraC family transcriptional regulator [Halomonas]MBE0462824.1 helix-turn-helix transcriptional regulator [Halomonas colorata]
MNNLSRPTLTTAQHLTEWVSHKCDLPHRHTLIERLDCEAGFSVVRSKISSGRVLREVCQHEGNERTLVITFGLSGQSEFLDRTGNRLHFSANQTTVSVFQEGGGERRYAADKQTQQLRLVVSESALRRYIGPQRCDQLLGKPLRHNESFRQLSHVNSRASQHLSFYKHPWVGEQDGLRQRIHALSLLGEQLNLLTPAEGQKERIIGRDVDLLERIEAYMRAHLDQPLNNAYLCAKLGISEYKLKGCFRQAYDTSPAQHLLAMRMQRAQELLAAGYRVSESAYQVGYQHPNNFTAAFTKFFGCTPKSVRGAH